MEDKIKRELDHLTAGQTQRLLGEEMKMQISGEEAQRIKNLVHRKIAGERRTGKPLPRRLVAWAAAFILVLAAVSLTGFDNVAAALGKLFSFIPGYGILENNRQIEYILSKQVSSENDRAKLTLSNAVATDSSVTVMFTLMRKNWDEAQGAKDKQEEWENLQSGSRSAHAKVTLYAGDRAVSEYSGYTGGGGDSDTSTFTYELKKEEISTGITYRLEDADYGLTVEFALKKYDSYSALEEIGATGYQNNISITAVPTFSDGKAVVDLYAINKSGYTLYSFGKADTPYGGDDIHLVTDSGTKDYTVPGGYMGVNGKFLFDILPSDRNFTLKIPYITVKSNEEKNISLPIPKVGQKITVNQKIEFKDCIMTVIDVERTSSHIGDYGELKMTVQYDNKSHNRVMLHPEFNRINFLGMTQSGAWSADVDENGVYTAIYYALDKGESGQLRLKVHSPLYCLTDGYELKFSR